MTVLYSLSTCFMTPCIFSLAVDFSCVMDLFTFSTPMIAFRSRELLRQGVFLVIYKFTITHIFPLSLTVCFVIQPISILPATKCFRYGFRLAARIVSFRFFKVPKLLLHTTAFDIFTPFPTPSSVFKCFSDTKLINHRFDWIPNCKLVSLTSVETLNILRASKGNFLSSRDL